ncbi:MAG: cache domain-containing protein [Poseidonibacter sp.]|uniref:sensor histidine kinase n=1 Tax=Poseidonibacter sp. TaxID=2321188 RepID=UPI00359EF3F6
MIYKNEKHIINIIKYSPPIFIISIAIIFILFLYIEKQSTFIDEKKNIKNEYLSQHKEIIKTQVNELYDFIIKTQKDTEIKLKENIKNRVYEAYAIVSKIYNENKDTKTKEEIKKLIKNALVNIRFNEGRGYYFIYTMNHEAVLIPIARHLEGKNFYDYTDSKGNYLIRNLVNLAKDKNEGFHTWWYIKPDDLNKEYKKIGFNKYFEPLDWFIGTGEYFVDFERMVKSDILDYISKLSRSSDNYFFVIDYDKYFLSHVKDEYVNKQSSSTNDFTELDKSITKMVKIAKNGEGYLQYSQNIKENKNEYSEKTSFVKGLQNWQWIIGKGFYEDELNSIIEKKEKYLNNKFNRYLVNVFSITAILTIILLIVSFYISKVLEEKFTKYKEEIQNHLDENTRQNHIVSQQSKMAAMGEMLTNIAHQWRQPLSVITTLASGTKIQKELNTLDDESLVKSLDTISDTAQYLSKTIDDFRNFFKSDKEEISFSIQEVLEQALKLTGDEFKNKSIDIIEEINEFQIFGLKNEFIQALINILNNAKDELEKHPEPRLIYIKAEQIENYGVITIKDNAGGIKEDIIDKVIEPYFTTKHQSKGTGIGLYMTEEIITKHMHGELIIENVKTTYEDKEYLGAQFTIKFKLSSQI